MFSMRLSIKSSFLLFLPLAFGIATTNEVIGADAEIRILSWNISDDAFVSDPAKFTALLLRSDPDMLLLDEVAPSASADQLRKTLVNLRPGDDNNWHIDVGRSGG